MASQRISTAKRMATMSKTEFMDYYFTRTEKNSPPRAGEKNQVSENEEERLNAEVAANRDAAVPACGRRAAPLLEQETTKLALGQIGIGVRRRTRKAGLRCRSSQPGDRKAAIVANHTVPMPA